MTIPASNLRLCVAFAFLAGCSDYDLHRPDKAEETPEDDVPPVEDEDTGPVLSPDIDIQPSSLDFGSLPRLCGSEWQTITISNLGDADLEISSLDFIGDGRDGFELQGAELPDEGTILIAPGDSIDVEIRFIPKAWVSYALQLEAESNDPDEPRAGTDLSGETAEDAMVEESFVQDLHEEVDILWVVDNSGSMSDDLTTVANNFEAFIQVFIDLGLDYHMGVITTDMDDPNQSGKLVGPYITPETVDPVATFTDQIDLGSYGSGSEVGFEAIQAALTDPLLSGHNAGFLRTDAALTAIVVSDEDNSSFMTTASFVSWFEALKPENELTTFSAICEDLFISCAKYAGAADQTGGITGDIAASDYATVLEQISLTSAGLTVSFDIAGQPSDLSRTTVTVEGVEVPNSTVDGWTYDAADQAIVFNGTAVPEPGESGLITYPVASACP